MTQLNTPYPSTAYITGFLREQGIDAVQHDLALATVLELLSKTGLAQLQAAALATEEATRSAAVNSFLDHASSYISTIDPTIAFLQGRDSTLCHRIASRGFLPEGPRFATLNDYADDEDNPDNLSWAFGALGQSDRARHLATLYLNDIADVLRDAVDEGFQFVRYAESLAASQPSFDALATALAQPVNLIDATLERLTLATVAEHQPTLVVLSVPFPGAVYAAFRIAQTIRKHHPDVRIALGGGFVNTELRELSDPRVFDFVDFVSLDGGERPLLCLIEYLRGKRGVSRLVRTFTRNAEAVVVYTNWQEPDVAFEDVGTPTWDGLPLMRYLSLLDMLNPMNRLWSDGRWNKLTVAHGCYWKKCSFCDVSLDYISRYDAARATTLVDRIERIVAETGQTGFHLVDEAAPPKVLKALATELIARGVHISWWGNIRFEKTFTPELCQLLAHSGCIAMSGGLEVASDRLLTLMQKGVTVDQVARVTKGFADAGVMVHAYLMYGFPTQTVQDTVDALEYVRQLFELGCIHSGFFHRFVCTVHSPVGKNPTQFGVTLTPLPASQFAKNDVGFIDTTLDGSGTTHDELGAGLKKAIYNYMHGIGFETPAHTWFGLPKSVCPRTKVKPDFVERALY